jgi:hypothetical protein
MRKGNWIQTYTGRQFWPLDPRPEEIHLEDIAHALSNQCRFSGHTKWFFSVAQHSANVAEVLLTEMQADLTVQRWGLLHDASEAYVVDVPRPIKRLMPAYIDAEEVVQQAIAERFGLPWPMPEPVHEIDGAMLATEAKFLLKPPPAPWEAMPEPLDRAILVESMPPQLAKDYFLMKAEQLGVQP